MRSDSRGQGLVARACADYDYGLGHLGGHSHTSLTTVCALALFLAMQATMTRTDEFDFEIARIGHGRRVGLVLQWWATADPAVYARLPKVQRDESRAQGVDRLELIGFLQVA